MIDKDTIIKLAREIYGDIPLGMASPAELERLDRFAQSIYRQGLEDAANVCEAWGEWRDFPSIIRKLGEQHE